MLVLFAESVYQPVLWQGRPSPLEANHIWYNSCWIFGRQKTGQLKLYSIEEYLDEAYCSQAFIRVLFSFFWQADNFAVVFCISCTLYKYCGGFCLALRVTCFDTLRLNWSEAQPSYPTIWSIGKISFFSFRIFVPHEKRILQYISSAERFFYV
jgi:hypothetical protein